ncbi:unnamed protein product [Fraxinus pennsylvanica]|uniref:Mono-/di-acylglycerol lipase N-terminal domain-containing protein n=1 Tax=Fraxinus pennsylvanica TaxID=56036 RepID=A0AAD2DQS6_9LAMI|nr:unnamed protein product [Fraxinus pennsylvanica]
MATAATMATGTVVLLYYVLSRRMATTTGTVVLLYYVLSWRMSSTLAEEDFVGGEYSRSKGRSVKKRLAQRPAQAPVTWIERISTLLETLGFTYSETLGKWPISDLAFGINYLIRRQVGIF